MSSPSSLNFNSIIFDDNEMFKNYVQVDDKNEFIKYPVSNHEIPLPYLRARWPYQNLPKGVPSGSLVDIVNGIKSLLQKIVKMDFALIGSLERTKLITFRANLIKCNEKAHHHNSRWIVKILSVFLSLFKRNYKCPTLDKELTAIDRMLEQRFSQNDVLMASTLSLMQELNRRLQGNTDDFLRTPASETEIDEIEKEMKLNSRPFFGERRLPSLFGAFKRVFNEDDFDDTFYKELQATGLNNRMDLTDVEKCKKEFREKIIALPPKQKEFVVAFFTVLKNAYENGWKQQNPAIEVMFIAFPTAGKVAGDLTSKELRVDPTVDKMAEMRRIGDIMHKPKPISVFLIEHYREIFKGL